MAAYRRGKNPEHDQMSDAVLAFQREWTGACRPPHVVAHRDEQTGQASFIIRGGAAQLEHLRQLQSKAAGR